jgi:hypothetical protein
MTDKTNPNHYQFPNNVQLIDPRWDEILKKLLSFFDYEDDWDGMDGAAASASVIESAIRIALTQRNALHPAPDAVAMTCNGTITFETSASESEPFPITTLEVVSEADAELYVGGEVLQTFTITKHLDFMTGNVVKYAARAGRKDGESRLDDLLKARWYIDQAIKQTQPGMNLD